MKDNRDNFNQNINSDPNLNEMPIEVSEDFVNAYIDATKMNAPDLWSRIDAGFDNEVRQMQAEQESIQTKTNIYNFPTKNNYNTNDNSTIVEQRQQMKTKRSFSYGKFGVIAAGILAIVIAIPVMSNISNGSKSDESLNYKGDTSNYSSNMEVAQGATKEEVAVEDSVFESEDVNGLDDSKRTTKNYLNAEIKEEQTDSITNWRDEKEDVGSSETKSIDDMNILASFEGEFVALRDDDGVYISVVDVIYLEDVSKLDDIEIKNDKYMIANYDDFEKMCTDKKYEVLSADETKIGEIIVYLDGQKKMCVITNIR